ncbi:hypothetical protein ACFU6I_33265 [Streptomyces sp. NPDC057486]|uniref:hypothetical protein n=1 Tax=Streptomyces sp. NPDC057486 TaxID=3346145 RepID=UPI0036CE92B5
MRGPLLEEMFTLPGASVHEYGTGGPAAYSVGPSVMKLGGRRGPGQDGRPLGPQHGRRGHP